MKRGTWTALAGCLLAVLLAGCATVVTGSASAAGSPRTTGTSASSTPTSSRTPPGGAAGGRAGTSTPAPPAPPAGQPHGPSGLLAFTTPSHNIACYVSSGTPGDATDPGQARCDIGQATWSPPARPASCQGDWGHALTVSADGPAFACVSDSAANDTVADYGTTQVRGAFSCAVEQTAVTCTDLDTGHGFAVSREKYQLF